MAGPFGANVFNFNYGQAASGEAWVDSTNLGALATQAFANSAASTAATNAAAPKVNRAGDTITGDLTVNGEMVAAAGYLRFQSSGGPGYIQWSGGGSYALGGGGTIWHTGNLNPVMSVRMVAGGDSGPGNGGYVDFGGPVTGLRARSLSIKGWW